jgi:hypothetical protein
MRVPKQRYFHLPDERDGAQYLESAAQPVVSGDRVRAVRRAKLLASVENLFRSTNSRARSITSAAV